MKDWLYTIYCAVFILATIGACYFAVRVAIANNGLAVQGRHK